MWLVSFCLVMAGKRMVWGFFFNLPVGQPVSPVHVSILLPPEIFSIRENACMMSSKYVWLAFAMGEPCQKPNALTKLRF
jgi:hypothetical protein